LDIPSPDSAPAALADLIAAGLVSHEMIGDPGRLGGEAEALRTLCGLVAGPVWRIEPFHYAFRVAPGDLGGACDALGGEARAAALEAALQGALGADAAWVNAADLVPGASATPPSTEIGVATVGDAGPLADAPLLLLRAQAEATREALEVAGGEIQAVIGARFAIAAARLGAEVMADAMAANEGRVAEGKAGVPDLAGQVAGRLGALEARQAALVAALEAEAALAERAREAQEAALDRLAGAVTALAAQVDAAAARAETAVERAASGEAERRAGLEAFRDTVGLTLAEFLAALERRAEAPVAVRVPQFS